MVRDLLIDSFTAAVLGAALSIDRTAAIQAMVSRPIVTAPVIGCLLGNTGAGLAAGVVIELLLIGDLPLGSYVPVDETGLAVLVTSVTVAFAGEGGAARYSLLDTAAVLPPLIVVGLIAAILYRKADLFTRRRNNRLFERAAEGLRGAGGGEANLMGENLKGMAPVFLINCLLLFVTIFPLSLVAVDLSGRMVDISFLYPALAACLVIGMAAAVKAVSTDRSRLIFPASGGAAFLIWFFLKG
ncbi:MAG: PTS sugar transporter subunit IIC [Thermodesulfobacteriota bacterium]